MKLWQKLRITNTNFLSARSLVISSLLEATIDAVMISTTRLMTSNEEMYNTKIAKLQSKFHGENN